MTNEKRRLIDADLLIAYFSGGEEMKSMTESIHDARFVKALQDAPTVEAVEVVRCKDCKHFKPAHFKADDGTETPWDETFSWYDRSDGIYHGGKCKHDRNTAYGQKDMAFRKPDDFCSYGEKRREGK